MSKAPAVPAELQREMVQIADTLLRIERAWVTNNQAHLDALMVDIDVQRIRMSRDLLAQWAVLTEQLEVAA